MGIVDFIFPKRCVSCRAFGSYICLDCFAKISFDSGGICVVCNKAAIDGLTHPVCCGKYTLDGAFAGVAFKPVVKKLVYHFKYKPHLTDLQATVLDLMHEGLIQKEVFMKKLTPETLLVPIPLHKSRLKMRGYNQSALLAKGIAAKLGLRWSDSLLRVKNTPSQIHLKREERYLNIKDAFQIKESDKERLQRMQVFLIDDIVTSGATFSEAANVLKRNGAKSVYGVAFSRGQ